MKNFLHFDDHDVCSRYISYLHSLIETNIKSVLENFSVYEDTILRLSSIDSILNFLLNNMLLSELANIKFDIKSDLLVRILNYIYNSFLINHESKSMNGFVFDYDLNYSKIVYLLLKRYNIEDIVVPMLKILRFIVDDKIIELLNNKIDILSKSICYNMKDVIEDIFFLIHSSNKNLSLFGSTILSNAIKIDKNLLEYVIPYKDGIISEENYNYNQKLEEISNLTCNTFHMIRTNYIQPNQSYYNYLNYLRYQNEFFEYDNQLSLDDLTIQTHKKVNIIDLKNLDEESYEDFDKNNIEPELKIKKCLILIKNNYMFKRRILEVYPNNKIIIWKSEEPICSIKGVLFLTKDLKIKKNGKNLILIINGKNLHIQFENQSETDGIFNMILFIINHY